MNIASLRQLILATACLSLLAMTVVLGSSLIGSVAFSAAERWQGLLSVLNGSENLAGTVLRLRLERSCMAFVTGVSLGLSGALMQILLRNPLAEPYILGLSGGAAVGALLAMLLGGMAWMIDGGAFLGAMAAIALVVGFTRFHKQSDLAPSERTTRVLLTGTVLSAGWGAVISVLLTLAPDGQLRNMVFWLLGDLSGAPWRPWIAVPTLLVLVTTCRYARALNVLALGANAAFNLGLAVRSTQRLLFVGASVLAAGAVTSAGSIGFVGLIVPHACRIVFGHDHRILLPAVALSSGIFLTLADTLARTVLAPQQLPVGVITALIGVPVFLMLLAHERR